jgi:hypothetical protein
MKPNENREEEILDEETFEEEETPAEGEEEEQDSPEEEETEEETEEEDEEESSEDTEEEKDEEEEDKDEEEEEPEKFKGKTREDVIKAYKNLESTIGTRALKEAQKLMQGAGLPVKKKDGTVPDKKELDEFEEELKKMDFTKMKPSEFARWMNNRIQVQATRIAQGIYERSTQIKQSVSREIQEAQKSHPHLKENKDYQDVVMSMIEASAARGKVLTLKEACQKADKAMGIKPQEKKPQEGEQKKKPKTAVEKPEGGDGGAQKSDEDKVKEGLLNAGSSSPLGGLGV